MKDWSRGTDLSGKDWVVAAMRQEAWRAGARERNVPPRSVRCPCRLAAQQKTRESNRFRGAPPHGEVVQSDGADSAIRRVQPTHGHRLKIRRAGPRKKQYGPSPHVCDLPPHGDGRPRGGYEPMARRASIRTPTRGLPPETTLCCPASVAWWFQPSTVIQFSSISTILTGADY